MNIINAEQLNFIKQKYSEPHRKYHNWQHVTTMFAIAEEQQYALSKVQKLAILFHDIVYVVDRNDNERESALMMRKVMEGTEERLLEAVTNMIEATAKHLEDQDDLDDETKYVLNLDLAKIGTEDYIENSVKLYQESSPYVDDLLNKRVRFLTSLTQRKQIYYDVQPYTFNEELARYNLNFEITIINQCLKLCQDRNETH